MTEVGYEDWMPTMWESFLAKEESALTRQMRQSLSKATLQAWREGTQGIMKSFRPVLPTSSNTFLTVPSGHVSKRPQEPFV